MLVMQPIFLVMSFNIFRSRFILGDDSHILKLSSIQSGIQPNVSSNIVFTCNLLKFNRFHRLKFIDHFVYNSVY